MKWSYIAGFFDGEGCVGKRHPSSHRPTYYEIAMYNTHERTAREIYKFLDRNGLRPKLYLRMRSRNNPKHSDCWTVAVRDVRSIEKFIEFVIPFCITKTDELKVALDWAKKTKGTRHHSNELLHHGLVLLKNGHTFREVRLATGVPPATMYRFRRLTQSPPPAI